VHNGTIWRKCSLNDSIVLYFSEIKWFLEYFEATTYSIKWLGLMMDWGVFGKMRWWHSIRYSLYILLVRITNHKTPRFRWCPRRQSNRHFLNKSIYLSRHAVVNFSNRCMSLEVLKAADIENVVWIVTPCRLLRGYQLSG